MTLNSLVKLSSLASPRKDILKEYDGLHLSDSNRVLCSRASNHLSCCITRIHATLTEPERKENPFMGISSFRSRGSINPNLLRSYSFDPDSSNHMNIVENDLNEVESTRESSEGEELKRTSWVESLVELGRNYWKNIWQKKAVSGSHNCYDEERRCRSYDRVVFSRFLVEVPWSDTKSFSRLAFLCNLAYIIPEMKATDLKRYYGLQFVTSSIDKQAQADDHIVTIKPKLDQDSTAVKSMASAEANLRSLRKSQQGAGENSCRKGGSSPQNHKSDKYENISTSKKGAGKEFQSLHLPYLIHLKHLLQERNIHLPCREECPLQVENGIDSLASWQTYFLFEPMEFEGTTVLVHRGIYELAKKLYEHFIPEIIDHLVRYGEQAKLQFTGHCLGGSLSVILQLMLLTRKVVSSSNLLPVVTFGSPYVFCGGQKIFEQLGLDECNHICSHPCLTKNKILYSPMGKLFIVQPDEMSSPPHPVLPLGSALYALDSTQDGFSLSVLMDILNSPHPLETLSDPTVYGSEGTILRAHDSSNYLKAMNGVVRVNTRKFLQIERKRSNILWPLLDSPPPSSWNHEDESDIES
ncbi:hypothetical protein ACLB2K_064238 [Fragaria x ananassa]